MLQYLINDIVHYHFRQTVDVVEEGQLFQIHEDTNVNCVVGANIQGVLEIILLRLSLLRLITF
jgi:hypothetical protein